MKNRYLWAGALALAIGVTSELETKAAYTNLDGTIITNGVVLITTRSAQDGWFHTESSSSIWDADDNRGPGAFTPGDAAMAELLQDNGYTTRMVPEKALCYYTAGLGAMLDWFSSPMPDPQTYYNGGGGVTGGGSASNVLSSAMLVIVSGSGSGADMIPPNTNHIPIISGEHTTLGDSTSTTAGHAQLYLWASKNSGNLTLGSSPGLYMTVVAPNHPIMQGIPLDSQGRVQMYRAPYPEENLHSTSTAKPNYELAWTYVDDNGGDGSKSVPAGGLTIIGRLSSNTNRVVFAAMEAGGAFAPCDMMQDFYSPWYNYSVAPSRIVQLWNNEGGSGNSRRGFNCLTDLGRVIFIRTCKWAMGETLTPYVPLGIIKVSSVGSSQVQLSWTGDAKKNYKVFGTATSVAAADFSNPINWQIVAQDIPGTNGDTSVRLNVASAPQVAYLRVMPVP
jgi:hypothetical protein